MDQPPTSPENLPASEVEMLLYRLQLLFIEWDPKMPGPWNVRRYVDGDKDNTFDIRHDPEMGVHELGARIKNPSMPSGYEVIEDTFSPDGRFLGDRKTGVVDEDYTERRAEQFNNLLARSTSKPYGRFGRMALKVMSGRYRWAI